jgi:hypothetical protein
MPGDCDLKIHVRIDFRTHDGQVYVETATGAIVPLEDPNGLVDSDHIGKSRTVEVQCTEWGSISLESEREPDIYPGHTGVTIVGDYDGERKYVEKFEELTFRFPDHLYPGSIPMTEHQAEALPVELFNGKNRIVIQGSTLVITDCYYVPLDDPFFPPILRDAVVDLTENSDDNPTIETVPVEPIDPATQVHTIEDLLTEDKLLHLTIDTRECLVNLNTTCCQLLERDDATAALGADFELCFEVVREGVRYISGDVLRLRNRGIGGTEQHWHVRLVTFAISVANAVLSAGDSYRTDGIVFELLRRGLASIEEDQLVGPRDPYEKYCGVVQGYSIATSSDPFAADRWKVPTEDLEEWALLDRNYDGYGLIGAYHDWHKD